MNPPTNDADILKNVLELMAPQLTDARRQRFIEVVQQRTEHFRLVIQDIHHPHNVSACLRSADAFGIMSVDVVTLKETFKPSSVARGVHHWLNITRHHTIESCVKQLKAANYLLCSAMPPQQSTSTLSELPVDRRLAIILGNEHEGVHNAWQPHIDIYFTIPMYGMVESLNISVSCAIILHELRRQAQEHNLDLALSLERQKEILIHWLKRHNINM